MNSSEHDDLFLALLDGADMSATLRARVEAALGRGLLAEPQVNPSEAKLAAAARTLLDHADDATDDALLVRRSDVKRLRAGLLAEGEESREPDIDRLASAAFEWDRRNGHHKGGPWTWHMIPEEGRENYRGMVQAILTEQRQ